MKPGIDRRIGSSLADHPASASSFPAFTMVFPKMQMTIRPPPR
jgi:hypothetical protein